MKFEVILAGVGGQGVLSVGAIISGAAVKEGLNVRQSEVHGMAQRGGAVLAHLRISDKNIAADMVPRGAADMILSMEPLEAIRYALWLTPKGASGQPGVLISAADPLENIPNYPDLSEIHNTIKKFPMHRIIEAAALAKEAGVALGFFVDDIPTAIKWKNRGIRYISFSADVSMMYDAFAQKVEEFRAG